MSAPAASYSPQYLAQNIGVEILATAAIFIFFSTAFVVLRYYARYLTQTKFGIEDALIPLAWLAEMGVCLTGILMVEKANTGRHTAFILMTDPGKVTIHYQGILALEFLHLPAVAFPKLVVVFLYLRVFTNKYARGLSWALVYLILGTWFSYTIASCFQCIPFAYNWDKAIREGHCFDIDAFSKSSSVPNIITDIAVLFLPLKTLKDLKVSKGRKLGLLFIFLTGSMGIIASIIRTVVFSRTDPLIDVTFTHTELVKWTIIEPGMYLFAACALSFKPLFSMVAKWLHLDHMMTHTRSIADKVKSKVGSSSGTVKSSIRMGTMKSSHAGFKKMHDEPGTDGESEYDVEQGRKSINIIVTKTVEMDSKTMTDLERREVERRAKAIGRAV